MNYFKLAWRNIWRNKRRTLITVASIFFGVLFSTVMSSMMDGTYQNMIDMMVRLSSGYIQVQHPEFSETRSVNNVFYPEEGFVSEIESMKKVTVVSRRIESFALFSSGPNTRGGAVIGFDPAIDKETSNLANWISLGSFIEPGDNGVLVTENIANNLQLTAGDSIIVIGQGYRGVTAAGLFPIKGIITFSTPKMNSLGIFMDIHSAQQLFRTEGMVTSLMIMVDDYTDVGAVKTGVESLTEELIVKDWTELNPDLVNFIEGDRAGGMLMITILYIVIAFGIFGTVIMMVAERKKEMAVMVAVGMRKFRLGLVLIAETVLIGFIGVIAGCAGSLPIIFALVNNPIKLPDNLANAYLEYGFEPYMFFGSSPSIFITQAIIVFIVTMVIAIYPVMKIKNMKISRAIKS